MPRNPLDPHIYFGLDLGQRNDPAALAILQRLHRNTGAIDPVSREYQWEMVFQLRHVERFRLGTPYIQIVDKLHHLIRDVGLGAHPLFLPAGWPLQRGHASNPLRTLVVDSSGVGAPVVELLLRDIKDCSIVPVTITSGEAAPPDPHTNNGFCVPRRDLISALRVLLELDHLKIAANINNRKELMEELTNLTDRPTAHHDDLATALATWQATKGLFRQDHLK
jgi:hypothetical protein